MSNWATQSIPRPHIFIQWKGTDICCDLYCICDKQFHLDVEFMYAVECPHCHRKFEVNTMLAMRELTKEELESKEWKDYDFKIEILREEN